MKKLKSTIPNGGAPLGQFPVLRELFDEENKNAIESILEYQTRGLTEGIVLSGCEISGAVGDWDVSPGYVYLDGEVLYFTGVIGGTLGLTLYIVKDTVTEEGGTFADGLTKNYIDVNVAKFDASPTGGESTQYITLTFNTNLPKLTDTILTTDSITTSMIVDNAIITNKIDDNAITSTKIDDLAVTTNKIDNNAVTSGKINTSSNINIDTGFDAYLSGNSNVQLQGSKTVDVSTLPTTVNTIASASYRPLFKSKFLVAGVTADHHAFVEVDTDGTITFTYSTIGTGSIDFDMSSIMYLTK